MVGGTWVTENKKRPGAYINVKSNISSNVVSDRGTVLLPLALNWGKGSFAAVNADSDFLNVLGYELNDEAMLPLRECLKRAKTVKVYKINGGVKASAVLGGLTITAACCGSRGNDVSCKIELDADAEKYIVGTYVNDELVDLQRVTDIGGLQSNDFVTFAGSGNLQVTAGLRLAGGSDAEATASDYEAFWQTAQTEDFDVLAVDSADNTVKMQAVAFIKKMREEEGMPVQAVLADYANADYEGVISVKNGVILSDGTVIDEYKAVYWVAGATAGAALNKSNTYSVYEDSVDVDQRYLNSQIADALDEGSFIFTPSSKGALVEQDINTFTSFTPTKGNILRKNRVLRVLDTLAGDIKELFNDYYLGKVNNNEDGRNLFKAQIIDYLTRLQSISAISGLDKQNDVVVSAGSEADSVIVNLAVMPVDSIEKLYMTVVVS